MILAMRREDKPSWYLVACLTGVCTDLEDAQLLRTLLGMSLYGKLD